MNTTLIEIDNEWFNLQSIGRITPVRKERMINLYNVQLMLIKTIKFADEASFDNEIANLKTVINERKTSFNVF